MDKIGLKSPRSHQVRTFEQALEALPPIGLPAIIRPSFTLGGTGGGIAYNPDEFEEIVKGGLRASPRSEEHTSELQSLMRISYAVFCLKKKKTTNSNSST